MKTNVSLTNVYFNKGLRDYFFREQSANTLHEILEVSYFGLEETLDIIDTTCEELNIDLDDLEEILYNETTEEILNYFGIPTEEEAEEEEPTKTGAE